VPQEFSKAFWEERYRGRTAVHDKQPSPYLMAEVANRTPGTALDAGCGEGANVIWLASQGWRVMAVDIASNALRHAREHAEAVGVSGNIEWVEADLTSWVPAAEEFDLVCAHYVHPAGSSEALFRRLAASVAPGGTLLIVDHDPADQHAADQHAADHGRSNHDRNDHDRTDHSSADEPFDPGQHLNPGQWDIAAVEARTRSVAVHDGQEVILRDAVFRARKRP
jgi:SAM-dependent methyltransferase